MIFPGVYGSELGVLSLLMIDDGQTVSSYFEPSWETIEKVIKEHKLPVEKTVEIIKMSRPDSHSIFIDVPKYLAALEEEN